MIRTILLLFAALHLGSCKAGDQCSEADPCGFGESCIEGVCVAKTCSSSQQCLMEQYCDKGECKTGCVADTDCYPGDVCDSDDGACVTGACRSSTLDCDFKEFCDPATGECYDASGYYCRECETDEQCGGNGNLCLNFGFQREFCGVTCGSEDDCPSGFTCIPVGVDQGVSYQCITYCWLYEDDDARRVDPARIPPDARPVPADPRWQTNDLPTCPAVTE